MKWNNGLFYLVNTAFLCQSAAAVLLVHLRKPGPVRLGQENSARTFFCQEPKRTRLDLSTLSVGKSQVNTVIIQNIHPPGTRILQALRHYHNCLLL